MYRIFIIAENEDGTNETSLMTEVYAPPEDWLETGGPLTELFNDLVDEVKEAEGTS